MERKTVLFKDLGYQEYKSTWDYQYELQSKIIQEKLLLRDGQIDEEDRLQDILLFVEHPHVYTLGKSGDRNNLLVNEKELEEIHASFYPNDRGGDITYHGPGQLVGYPILDLNRHFTDLHKYLRYLEEIIINVCAEYGIAAGRKEKLTGVWVGEEKICAMGVKCSRWVTMHGFALNVNTDLSYFNHIVPCGIQDKGVTSLEKILGTHIDLMEVQKWVKKHFQMQFNVELKETEFLPIK